MFLQKFINKSFFFRSKMGRGFTLIELLIVVGILSILATVVLLVINPAQLIKQSRDANRIEEISQINEAFLLYQSFGGSSDNIAHQKINISLPDSDPQCGSYYGQLPATTTGWNYHCSPASSYRNMNGTGWIPVDLESVQSSAGSLFANLPIDPLQSSDLNAAAANGYYYTYIHGSWALSAVMESDKYIASNAANDGGKISTRFEVGNNLNLDENLTVNESVPAVTVPGAPTIGTATAGNAQASVAFTAPASNGGSAIIDYTATSNPGGLTSTSASSPITVTGLTNGTAYTFTVTARNSVGTGPVSSASNSVTPAVPVTVPGAPTIGTATAGNASASITFTAPASNGGSSITGYTATSNPGGLTGTGSASPISVSGLTNSTAYTFTVTATNAIGTGASSAASNSVTPVAPPDITTGLVRFWHFSSNMTDSVGGYTGTLSMLGYVSGKSGNGIDGTAGCGNWGASVPVPVMNTFSVSYWWKPPCSGTPYGLPQLSQLDSSVNYYGSHGWRTLESALVNGSYRTLSYYEYDTNSQTASLTTNTGTSQFSCGSWHHVVLTRAAGGQVKFYVDGSVIADSVKTASAATFTTSKPIYITGDPGISCDWGDASEGIDELRVYNIELSAAQVGAIYALEN